MGMKPFEYQRPASLGEALELKARFGGEAAWLAGGTDLLPRAKQALAKPAMVISLADLAGELGGISQDGGFLTLGSMASLHQVAGHPTVAAKLPGLVRAVRSIGAYTLQRHAGTIGGNVMLETRCLYYNQSEFWRSGLAPCFKLGGEVCHPGGATADRCRSAFSGDGAVMLAALGARVALKSASGSRELPFDEFFTGKGETPTAIAADELLCAIKVPLPPAGEASAYHKVAWRGAVDYPLVSAAARLRIADGQVTEAALYLGAAFAAPLALRDAMNELTGQPASQDSLARAAAKASRHAEPFFLDNLGATREWRAEMAGVAAKRVLFEALRLAEGNND